MWSYGVLMGFMGSYEGLWDPIGVYGVLWGLYAVLWGPMGSYEGLWDPMGPYGALGGLMGDVWGPPGRAPPSPYTRRPAAL